MTVEARGARAPTTTPPGEREERSAAAARRWGAGGRERQSGRHTSPRHLSRLTLSIFGWAGGRPRVFCGRAGVRLSADDLDA